MHTFHPCVNKDFFVRIGMYCLSTAKTVENKGLLLKSYKNTRTINKSEDTHKGYPHFYLRYAPEWDSKNINAARTSVADGLTEANHTICPRQIATRPVAVPDKIFGLTHFLDFIDRCHSLASFLPPPAAVGSLPLPVYRRPLGGKRQIAASLCS